MCKIQLADVGNTVKSATSGSFSPERLTALTLWLADSISSVIRCPMFPVAPIITQGSALIEI